MPHDRSVALINRVTLILSQHVERELAGAGHLETMPVLHRPTHYSAPTARAECVVVRSWLLRSSIYAFDDVVDMVAFDGDVAGGDGRKLGTLNHLADPAGYGRGT